MSSEKYIPPYKVSEEAAPPPMYTGARVCRMTPPWPVLKDLDRMNGICKQRRGDGRATGTY